MIFIIDEKIFNQFEFLSNDRCTNRFYIIINDCKKSRKQNWLFFNFNSFKGIFIERLA